MSFNITAIITNYVGGSVTLSEAELESLVDGALDSGGVFVSSGSTLVLYCDLANRYNIDDVQCYFYGQCACSIYVAESLDAWVLYEQSSSNDGYTFNISGYSPRWFKIIFAPTENFYLYEIEVHNDGSNILFGPSGQFDSYGIDTTGSTIHEVQIYNNTSTVKDLNVFIGGDGTVSTYTAISTSISGVFYRKYDNSVKFPTDYSWDNGVHYNTEATVSGHLTLSGVSTSGTYYSPVFDIFPYVDTRFFWDSSTPSGSKIDYYIEDDNASCFGVRFYHIPPSGVWTSGQVAWDGDPTWSIFSGSLDFIPIQKDEILELRNNRYVQFAVTLTGLASPYIYSAGVEGPITVSGVGPFNYGTVYTTLVSGTASGQQAELVCWYKE